MFAISQSTAFICQLTFPARNLTRAFVDRNDSSALLAYIAVDQPSRCISLTMRLARGTNLVEEKHILVVV